MLFQSLSLPTCDVIRLVASAPGYMSCKGFVLNVLSMPAVREEYGKAIMAIDKSIGLNHLPQCIKDSLCFDLSPSGERSKK